MYNYRTGEETVVTFKNKTYSETPGFGLRNRFLLTVICYPINHWLEVSREVDISRARIYSLTTDRQPVTYWATNHLLESVSILTHKKRRKGKCILQMLPVFRHCMKRNPVMNFDCNRGIYMYFVSLCCEQTTLHRQTLWK